MSNDMKTNNVDDAVYKKAKQMEEAYIKGIEQKRKMTIKCDDVQQKLFNRKKDGLYSPIPAGWKVKDLLELQWPFPQEHPYAIVGYIRTQDDAAPDGMAIFNTCATLAKAKHQIEEARQKNFAWTNIHVLYLGSGWFSVPPTEDQQVVHDVLGEQLARIRNAENDVLGQVSGAKFENDAFFLKVVEACKAVMRTHLVSLLSSHLEAFQTEHNVNAEQYKLLHKFVCDFTSENNIAKMLDEFDPLKKRNLLFEIIGVQNNYERLQAHREREKEELERWRKEAEEAVAAEKPRLQSISKKLIDQEMKRLKKEANLKKIAAKNKLYFENENKQDNVEKNEETKVSPWLNHKSTLTHKQPEFDI